MLGKSQSVVMMSMRPSTKIVKFMVMTPRSGVQVPGKIQHGHIVKMYLILENLVFYSHKTLWKLWFLKTMKLMVPGSGAEAKGRGQYAHIVKMYSNAHKVYKYTNHWNFQNCTSLIEWMWSLLKKCFNS